MKLKTSRDEGKRAAGAAGYARAPRVEKNRRFVSNGEAADNHAEIAKWRKENV